MEKFVRGISRVLAVISALAIFAMVVAIALDVIYRNTTGASFKGMIEIAETAMVTAVAFGLAWAGVQGEHVAVTLLTDRLGAGAVRVINIFVWALSTGYVGWLVYSNLLRSIDSTRVKEIGFGTVQWPVYPMRWILLIGFFTLLLVCLVNLFRALTGSEPMGFSDEVEAALAETEAATPVQVATDGSHAVENTVDTAPEGERP